MKFQEGANKFRILSSAIVGFEYWNLAGKPVRSKTPFQGTPSDIRVKEDGTQEKIKHFWAFVCWDSQDKQVKILEVTQVGIMNAIKSLVDNEDWGDPKQYDITVTRTGSGLDTEYSVMPSPAKELPMEVANAYASETINLEALYDGADPFSTPKEDVSTELSPEAMDEVEKMVK